MSPFLTAVVILGAASLAGRRPRRRGPADVQESTWIIAKWTVLGLIVAGFLLAAVPSPCGLILAVTAATGGWWAGIHRSGQASDSSAYQAASHSGVGLGTHSGGTS